MLVPASLLAAQGAKGQLGLVLQFARRSRALLFSGADFLLESRSPYPATREELLRRSSRLRPCLGWAQEMGEVLHRRLDASKVSVQKVLGMLHALANAESTYAHALQRVSNIDLAGEGDGPSLRRLVRSFTALPAAVGAMHGHVRHLPEP